MEMIIIYMLVVSVIIFLIIYNKDKIDKIGVDDGVLVELKLDNDVIPTTRKWGIWGSIISGVGLIVSSEFISGIVVIIVGISTTIGFVILLEGFSTIIKLLRKISNK
jgi:hypothetical protein